MARCEAKLSKDYLRSCRDRPEIDGQCRRVAMWLIDGKKVCGEHASLILLEHAKRAGVIEPVEVAPGEREYRQTVAE
jgi:hypothetical protein